MQDQDHHLAVVKLLDVDPFSADAARLRAEIDRLERSDPALIAQRIAIMTAHSRPIGEAPPADRRPAGTLLT